MDKDLPLMISDIARGLSRPVVLVGMMGSGKSRMGARLADQLGLEFFDTDRLIEEKAGYSINEIFSNDGEAKFRDVERKTLLSLLDKGACVVATGGGAVMNEGVPEALAQKAVTVWLRADLAETAERLRKAKNRPLLKDGNIEETLKTLLAKREPYYSRANITVDTAHISADETFVRLIKALCGFLKEGKV